MPDETNDIETTDTDMTEDGDETIAEYLGEDAVAPLERFVDERFATLAAAQAPDARPEPAAEPAPESAPVSALDRDALDDQLLDHLLDGNTAEAQRLQQQPSAYSKPEGTIG